MHCSEARQMPSTNKKEDCGKWTSIDYTKHEESQHSTMNITDKADIRKNGIKQVTLHRFVITECVTCKLKMFCGHNHLQVSGKANTYHTENRGLGTDGDAIQCEEAM